VYFVVVCSDAAAIEDNHEIHETHEKAVRAVAAQVVNLE
jgi:hypothetical protein